MPQKLEVPHFANEAQEARWWFENQDVVADEFELAEKEGRLGHGTAVRKAKAAALAAALDPEDAERARLQAERRGMEYHTYLKMVVHEALLLEEKRA